MKRSDRPAVIATCIVLLALCAALLALRPAACDDGGPGYAQLCVD